MKDKKEMKREPCVLIDLNGQELDKKIKISPIGAFTGVDGRSYNLDGARVVEKTRSRNIDIVLNVNHGFDEHREKAAGWFDFNSLEVKEDGIYALLAPTDIGAKAIKEKHYRYLSPEYRISRNGELREVLEFVGVALSNRPNLLDKALNNEEETPNPEEDEVEKPTDNEKELQKQLDSANEKNKQMEETAKQTKIDTAVNNGELLPKNRDFAMGLEGEQLNNFLELNKEDMKHLGGDTKPDKHNDDAQISDEQKEVNRQLGLGDDK